MPFRLNKTSPTPLYLQIRDQLRARILSGELAAGTRLPPERALAQDLGVNRTTVVNAYHELAAEGLVEAHVGRGTTVRALAAPRDLGAAAMPWADYLATTARARRDPLLRDLETLCTREDVISLAAGVPAPDLYPIDEFRAALDTVLARDGRVLLQHGPVEGHYPLRVAIAARLGQRGASVRPDNVLLVSGSQQGLDLVARALIEPGDAVIVESPCYLGALYVFRSAGARLISVPVDDAGMHVGHLESLLARGRPKLIYTLPTFQNPTGTVLSVDRRERLLDLARRHQVPILEDDPYGELRYEGDDPPLLKSLDTGGHVIYLTTFSTILFPGLRLGWLAAPTPVIERLTMLNQLGDLHPNTPAQWAVTELSASGFLDAHLARLRAEYPRRRDAMLAALEKHCRADLTWNRPRGGFYLWCRLRDGLRARDLFVEAAESGVAFVAGEAFYLNSEGQREFRLNFSYPTPDVIAEGVKRLGAAMARLKARQVRQRSREIAQAVRPIV